MGEKMKGNGGGSGTGTRRGIVGEIGEEWEGNNGGGNTKGMAGKTKLNGLKLWEGMKGKCLERLCKGNGRAMVRIMGVGMVGGRMYG